MMITSTVFKTKFLPSTPKIAFNQVGDGELIIFIHGIGGNKENWQDNIEVLSKNFNTVAIDLRGYGESDDFEGPMNFFDDGQRKNTLFNRRRRETDGGQCGA